MYDSPLHGWSAVGSNARSLEVPVKEQCELLKSNFYSQTGYFGSHNSGLGKEYTKVRWQLCGPVFTEVNSTTFGIEFDNLRNSVYR